MTSFGIYKKTFGFSLRRILLSLISLVLIVGLPVAAYYIAGQDNAGLIAGGMTFVVLLILVGIANHFLGYVLEAGQVAMIAEGVQNDTLPGNVYSAGKAAVKSRFATVAIYYAVTGLIRGITRQITSGVSKLTDAVSGDNNTVKAIGGLIELIVSIVLYYVNKCCLAWVFLHPDQNAFKSTCDGAVLYFQNWKALLGNVGKVLLVMLLTLAIIAAPIAVGLHSATVSSPALMETAEAINADLNEALQKSENGKTGPVDTATMIWIVCGVIALVVWGILYSTLIAPFVLVLVLKGYIKAANENPPKVDVYGKLCKLSAKFKKCFTKSGETVPTEA